MRGLVVLLCGGVGGSQLTQLALNEGGGGGGGWPLGVGPVKST